MSAPQLVERLSASHPNRYWMKVRNLWLLVAAFLATAVFWEGLASHPPGAGDTAPPFTATALDGRRVTLADYRGHSAVLLNFFADH